MDPDTSEEGLTATLEGYNVQVQQLEMALGVTTDRATRMELTMLLRDMKELVDLTQDSLLTVKKRKLMAMLESASSTAPKPATSTMDDEFAAFQAAIADDVAEPTNSTESAPPDSNGKPPDSPEEEEPVEEYANPFGDQSAQDNNKTTQGCYDVQDSRQDSYDVQDSRQGLYDVQDSRQKSYNVQDSRQGTYNVQDSRHGLYDVQDSRQGSHNVQDSRQDLYDVQDSRQHVPCVQDSRQGLYNVQDSRQGSYNVQKTRQGLSSVHSSRQDLYGGQDSPQGLYTEQDSPQGLYTAHDSRRGLYDVQGSRRGLSGPHHSPQGLPSVKDSQRGLYSAQDSPQDLYPGKDSPKGLYGVQGSRRGYSGVKDNQQGLYGVKDSPQDLYPGLDRPQGVYDVQDSRRGLSGVKDNQQGLYGAQDSPQDLYAAQDSPQGLYGAQDNPQSLYGMQDSRHTSSNTSHWGPSTDVGQSDVKPGEEEEDDEDYPVDYANPFGDQSGEAGGAEQEVDGAEEEDDGLDDILKEIVGARCRVSYTHEWGEQRQHNAMVVGAEPMDGESEPKVRVMFCNPTHRTLVPCPFYLQGRCKFEDDKCRYSHGFVVPVDEIEAFQEVDHSLLRLESRCLARYSDDVWYPAIVVEVGEDNQFKVMFDKYDEAEDVEVEDIIPLEDYGEGEGSEDEASASRFELSDEDDEKDALPVYLWRPNQTTDSLGDWEKHTKGFGSRIMARMGYITGQGLGLYGEGRAEPVPIQLLPPGKSLDKIMELKELAGDQDLYDVMKRNRRKHKVTEVKATAGYKKVVRQERTTFDFINKKLTGKKGNLSDLMRVGPRGSKVERKTIAAHELTKKSDKHINIQLLKTDEEARNVEKEIKRLKESLQRNDGKGGDKGVVAAVRQRMASMESYLSQLRSSSSSIQRHKQMRNDHKKYTVF